MDKLKAWREQYGYWLAPDGCSQHLRRGNRTVKVSQVHPPGLNAPTWADPYVVELSDGTHQAEHVTLEFCAAWALAENFIDTGSFLNARGGEGIIPGTAAWALSRHRLDLSLRAE